MRILGKHFTSFLYLYFFSLEFLHFYFSIFSYIDIEHSPMKHLTVHKLVRFLSGICGQYDNIATINDKRQTPLHHSDAISRSHCRFSLREGGLKAESSGTTRVGKKLKRRKKPATLRRGAPSQTRWANTIYSQQGLIFLAGGGRIRCDDNGNERKREKSSPRRICRKCIPWNEEGRRRGRV